MLKKVCASVLSIVLVLLFCSCGIPAQKRECFSVPENFVCDFSVTENGTVYTGTLEKENGRYTLNTVSPETVNGIEVIYENGKYSVSYGESNMSLIPEESFFLKDVVEFIEDTSQDSEIDCEEKDGKYIIKQNNWEIAFNKE